MKRLKFSWVRSAVFSPFVADLHSLVSLVRTLPTYVCNLFGVVVMKRSAHTSLINQVNTLLAEIERMNAEEPSARAQLMQLRVYQSEQHNRMGFMVSAFIPEEVANRLKDAPLKDRAAFSKNVADILVFRATEGIFHLSKQGKPQALIFEPVRKLGTKSDYVVSTLFEAENKRLKIV